MKKYHTNGSLPFFMCFLNSLMKA